MSDMFFEHDYARSKTMLRVVYIEYQDGEVHEVNAEHNGIQHHFDFEPDCKECERYMFYNSGGGGKITSIQGPHYIKGANASYWIHPDAKFGRYKPKNCIQLKEPIAYDGEVNPFKIGREIYGQDYCKFCKKWYDEDACPDHHTINEKGELEYTDGSKIED